MCFYNLIHNLDLTIFKFLVLIISTNFIIIFNLKIITLLYIKITMSYIQYKNFRFGLIIIFKTSKEINFLNYVNIGY